MLCFFSFCFHLFVVVVVVDYLFNRATTRAFFEQFISST